MTRTLAARVASRLVRDAGVHQAAAPNTVAPARASVNAVLTLLADRAAFEAEAMNLSAHLLQQDEDDAQTAESQSTTPTHPPTHASQPPGGWGRGGRCCRGGRGPTDAG